MFRTEYAYGEGYRKAANVMAHETFELRNTDILETLSSTILKGRPICEKLNRLVNILDNEVDYVFDYDEDFDENGLIIKNEYNNEPVIKEFDGKEMIIIDYDGCEMVITKEDIELINILGLYEDNETLGIEFYNEILSEIKEVTNKDIKFVLWLAERDAVIKYYGNNGVLADEHIDEYPISDIILSNLGVDGILFGYEEAVEPI